MESGKEEAKDLCILDDEMAGGENESNEGGREEHLNDRDIAIVAAEDLGEGIGVVNAEAF